MFLKRLAGVAAVLLCAGVASAATTKIKEFVSTGSSVNGLTPDADGIAIFNLDESTGITRMHVHVHGLAPNTAYGVVIQQFNSAVGDIYAPAGLGLTTNEGGSGTWDSDAFTIDLGPGMAVYIVDGTQPPGAFDLAPPSPSETFTVGIAP